MGLQKADIQHLHNLQRTYESYSAGSAATTERMEEA
jgi:hypothetical protein